MTTKQISTELKKYKLVVNDGGRIYTIHLSDLDVARYMDDKEAGKHTFFLNGNEYEMRNLKLRKIEDKKNIFEADQHPQEDSSLDQKYEKWKIDNKSKYNKIIGDEHEIMKDKLQTIGGSEKMIRGLSLAAARIRIQKMIDPDKFLPKKIPYKPSIKNTKFSYDDENLFCLIDSYFTTTEIDGNKYDIHHLVSSRPSAGKFISTGREWYGVRIKGKWKTVEEKNGKTVFTGKTLKI